MKKGCFRKWAPILPSDRDIALAKEDIKVSTSAALGCANTIEILTDEKVDHRVPKKLHLITRLSQNGFAMP